MEDTEVEELELSGAVEFAPALVAVHQHGNSVAVAIGPELRVIIEPRRPSSLAPPPPPRPWRRPAVPLTPPVLPTSHSTVADRKDNTDDQMEPSISAPDCNNTCVSPTLLWTSQFSLKACTYLRRKTKEWYKRRTEQLCPASCHLDAATPWHAGSRQALGDMLCQQGKRIEDPSRRNRFSVRSNLLIFYSHHNSYSLLIFPIQSTRDTTSMSIRANNSWTSSIVPGQIRLCRCKYKESVLTSTSIWIPLGELCEATLDRPISCCCSGNAWC